MVERHVMITWNSLLSYFDHFLNVLMVKDAIIGCGMHKQCLLQASTLSTLASISEPDDEGNIYMQQIGLKIPLYS